MEPNIIRIEKQVAENIELYHYLIDLNAEKMNVGEEIRLKEKNKFSC